MSHDGNDGDFRVQSTKSTKQQLNECIPLFEFCDNGDDNVQILGVNSNDNPDAPSWPSTPRQA